MSEIDTVYRDNKIKGDIHSGEHWPDKPEIRALLKQIQSSGGQAVTRNTLSALNAVTPPAETYMGIVLTGTGAGMYSRSGGAWVFGRPFPDTFAKVVLSGSGAAQTGVVSTGVNPAGVEVFYARVITPNAGPLTLTIGGEPPREVLNLAGNPLAVGEWTGTVMFELNDTGQYQLVIDAGAAASAAASATLAGAEADRAEQALADALAMIVPDDSVSEPKLVNGAVTTPKLADGAVTEVKAAAAFTATLTTTVASYAALRVVNTSRYGTAILADAKKHGIFVWDSSDLSSTLVVATELTTSIAGNVCTKVDHGLYTGHAVVVSAAVNGLAVNTVYYAIRLGKDTFSLASTFLNARAGTAITLSGTTNFTASRLKDAAQGVYVIKTGAALNGSAGAWVRQGPTLDACMFGAVGDASTNDLEAIQMAVDFGRAFWLLEGRHRLIGTIPTIFVDDDTEIYCVSTKSTIMYTTASVKDMIAGRKAGGGATAGNGERNFRFRMYGGTMESNGYGDAFNFLSTSDVRIRDVWGYNLNVWAKNGGDGSEGAFYNEFDGCLVSSIGSTAYINGTLGNAIRVNNGRVTDAQVATSDNDNTDVIYDKVAFETIRVAINRVSNDGDASQAIKYNMVRRENPNTSGAYASTVGLVVSAAGQSVVDLFPMNLMIATVYADSGTDTAILDNFTNVYQIPLPHSSPGGSNRLWNNSGVVTTT